MFLKSINSILLIVIFFNNTLLSEGFIAGTLVKTKDKYIPIEQLKENDSVVSYNFNGKNTFESKILKVKKQNYNQCIKLILGNKEIITAPDHKFFCPLKKGNWIEATNLQNNDFILSGIKELVRIESLFKSNLDTDFYCLSIENNHNFFVSEKDIFVHNVAPAVFILGAIGGFEITLDIAGLFGGIAAYAFSRAFNKPNLKAISKIVTAGSAGSLVYNAARAPGKPTQDVGFKPKKNWDGKKKIHDETGQCGYPDKNGDLWVPTGEGSDSHAGPHWDIVDQDGNHVENVYPDGHRR